MRPRFGLRRPLFHAINGSCCHFCSSATAHSSDPFETPHDDAETEKFVRTTVQQIAFANPVTVNCRYSNDYSRIFKPNSVATSYRLLSTR